MQLIFNFPFFFCPHWVRFIVRVVGTTCLINEHNEEESQQQEFVTDFRWNFWLSGDIWKV